PLMNRPYESSSVTTAVDSGAGAYSHGTDGWIASLMTLLVHREVVAALVPAGAFLVDLHQHVVQQRGRADAEPVGRHPVRAERLEQDRQVLDRLLGHADASGDLDAHLDTGLPVEVARG